MKTIISGFIGAFTTFVLMLTPEPTDFDYIAEHSNVSINNQCSGTIINEQYQLILTNSHCLKPMSTVKKNQGNTVTISYSSDELYVIKHEQKYKAKIFAQDKKRDLMILHVPNKMEFAKAVKIASSDIKIKRGDEVFSIGNPHQRTDTLTKGIISNTQRKEDDTDNQRLQYSNGSFPGQSGGSLLNTKGELIGVTSEVENHIEKRYEYALTYMAYAITIDQIRDFLAKNCLPEYRGYVFQNVYGPKNACIEERLK